MPWQGEFFSERLNVLQESGNLGLEVGVCFHESLEIPESRSGTVLLRLLGQLNTWRRRVTRTKKMCKLLLCFIPTHEGILNKKDNLSPCFPSPTKRYTHTHIFVTPPKWGYIHSDRLCNKRQSGMITQYIQQAFRDDMCIAKFLSPKWGRIHSNKFCYKRQSGTII